MVQPRFTLHATASNSVVADELNPSWHAPSAQNIGHLPVQCGATLNLDVLKYDVFYGLSELFVFAAVAENQFLNYLESHIGSTLRNFHGQEEYAQLSLRYCKELLQEHVQQILAMYCSVNYEAERQWPRSSKASHHEMSRTSRSDVLEDFETLLQKAKALAEQCVEGQAMIVNDSALNESKRAMELSEGLITLTRLAFFFVPLSFTTSFFGMNFKSLGRGHCLFGLVLLLQFQCWV